MKIKTLSEICQLVKKEYVEGMRYDEWEQETVPHSGMCSVVDYLVIHGFLSFKDEDRFMTEYRKYTKNRKVFYNYDGQKSESPDQFAWKIPNRPARIKWLDQRI